MAGEARAAAQTGEHEAPPRDLILERLVGPVFNYIANTMVDSFVRRAEVLYGGR